MLPQIMPMSWFLIFTMLFFIYYSLINYFSNMMLMKNLKELKLFYSFIVLTF